MSDSYASSYANLTNYLCHGYADHTEEVVVDGVAKNPIAKRDDGDRQLGYGEVERELIFEWYNG